MNIEHLYYSSNDPDYSNTSVILNYQNLNAVLDVLKDGVAYSEQQVVALASANINFLTPLRAGTFLRILKKDGKVQETIIGDTRYYKIV
ncbi:MAG: hypothetical protein IKV26_06840 [Paludibacteraceae bacterium]|nr:hypothetical protein [Paludibacteraceae bacterium]